MPIAYQSKGSIPGITSAQQESVLFGRNSKNRVRLRAGQRVGRVSMVGKRFQMSALKASQMLFGEFLEQSFLAPRKLFWNGDNYLHVLVSPPAAVHRRQSVPFQPQFGV